MVSSNGNIFRVTGQLRGIHRSLHKGQWRGVLMFSLISAWINGWVNNREADDLRRNGAHYDVILMSRAIWNINANLRAFSVGHVGATHKA